MPQVQKSDQTSGYVSLTTLLVVVAIMTVVGLSSSLLAISNSQMGLGIKKSKDDYYHLESCVEDALLYMKKRNTLPATIILPNGTCNVTVNSHTGNDWTFTVSQSNLVYPKSIQVICNKSGAILITSWKTI